MTFRTHFLRYYSLHSLHTVYFSSCTVVVVVVVDGEGGPIILAEPGITPIIETNLP